ncbi:MAG TPA: hypothetical protein PKE64_05920 [Anaerolineae bacterium]|nr:hypothetical protein [Anaerolineae bacterium]HMR63534.1 hypothetical protein [Anaerolineae bacterium]
MSLLHRIAASRSAKERQIAATELLAQLDHPKVTAWHRALSLELYRHRHHCTLDRISEQTGPTLDK